jgi:Rad3-related DNA helicase
LPALRRAFQCAGRHVRNPGKVGMVFFLDSRFAQTRIIKFMPDWLTEDLSASDLTVEEVATLTRDFFHREKST